MRTEKPRLALVHYTAPPTLGDVESTIAAHARLFADHDYAVKIIAGRGEIFDARVPVEILPLLDSRHSFGQHVDQNLKSGLVDKEFRSLTAAIRHLLQRALAETDVCIAHNIATLHKNLALSCALHEIAATRRPRVIAWCHEFAWNDPAYVNELHPGLPWNLLRQTWAETKYVVESGPHQIELARLLGIDPVAIAVVPPGIHPLGFLGATEKTGACRRELKTFEPGSLRHLTGGVTRRYRLKQRVSNEYTWERIFAERIEPLVHSIWEQSADDAPA